jgi:hypothetical protein
VPRKRWNVTLLFNFTKKMLIFPFMYEYCKQMGTTAVPKTSLWYCVLPDGFCWQSTWSLRLIYSCPGQIYVKYRTLTITTWVWLTQLHKGIMSSPYGTSSRFLFPGHDLLRSLPPITPSCVPVFFPRIEQFSAIIPHFVFPTVPRLFSGPFSSGTSFQNSVLNCYLSSLLYAQPNIII